MGSKITSNSDVSSVSPEVMSNNQNVEYKPENSRTIPLGIRLKALDRDNFRCIYCGKSPATDVGIKLHIDHIIPFSKGGKSILDNLQTLCEDCNLGKSDRNITIKQIQN